MTDMKAGYKQTDIGSIPEDWDVRPIHKLGKIYGGLSGKVKTDFGHGNAFYIPFMNIMNNVVINMNYFENVRVSKREIQQKTQKGDLFFNGSSETPEEVGMCSVLLDEVFDLYLNSFCFGFRLNNLRKIDGLWLAYFFRSNFGRQLIYSLAQGATRYNLSKNNFLELKIPVPQPEEQRQIAAVLSDVDGLIEGLEKLITKKRDMKTAAMQQLLTGKKRLPEFEQKKGYKQTDIGVIPEDWDVRLLGDVSRISMGQSPLSKFYNTNGAGLPLVQGNADIKNRKTITRQYSSQITKLGKKGEIILTVRAPVGAVAKAAFDCCLGRGVCSIRYPNDYLFYYLQNLEDGWAKYTAGSTFDSINSDHVKKILIPLPKPEEQKAIAAVLSDVDGVIDALEQRLEKARYLKIGMMQELLTGKIRLIKTNRKQEAV